MGRPRSLAWLGRLLRPNINDCLVVWLLGGLCFGVPIAHAISNNDTWWHLRTGRLIIETGHVPSVDPFSYTMAGRPWVAHEWLSETILWLTYSKLGFGGISLLRSLLILATFIVVFATARRRASAVKAAIAVTAIAAIISLDGWSERPQLFSYLFLAILVWLIDRARRGGSLWPVVPLFALWVNLHAGWPVGVIVLLWSGMEWGWTAFRGGSREMFLRFLKVAPFAVAALFINPSPLVYVTYPLQYLGATHHTGYITEWQSPNFHDLHFAVFALLLLGLTPLLRASKAKLNPFETALVLGLAGASLFSLRHIPVFAILSAPFLAGLLGALPRLSSDSATEQQAVREPVLLNWVVILILPVMILLMLPRRGATPYLDLHEYPVKSFDYLARRQGGGKLLTSYDDGSYAIYRLWPKYRVYVDGRADLYGPEMIRRVKVIDDLSPAWRRELKRARPDAIVWPSDEALSQALELTGEWRRIPLEHGDKGFAVFLPVEKRTR